MSITTWLGALAAGLLTLPAPSASAPAAARCPSGIEAQRLKVLINAAQYRYSQEHGGAAVHQARSRVEHDPRLVRDLASGAYAAAQVEADALLVRHVVRIRITLGPRALVDANPTSFAVSGAIGEIRGPRGQPLGRLEVSIQDVAGYVKLVHQLAGGEVVVRDRIGRVQTSLAAAARARLPGAGCASVGGQRYAVGTFTEPGFAGAKLTVTVLWPLRF